MPPLPRREDVDVSNYFIVFGLFAIALLRAIAYYGSRSYEGPAVLALATFVLGLRLVWGIRRVPPGSRWYEKRYELEVLGWAGPVLALVAMGVYAWLARG
ncbi:MAG: hypothetical protein ABFD96_17200 [Armatimonadia bacterium]